jgi:hypothetical protein
MSNTSAGESVGGAGDLQAGPGGVSAAGGRLSADDQAFFDAAFLGALSSLACVVGDDDPVAADDSFNDLPGHLRGLLDAWGGALVYRAWKIAGIALAMRRYGAE